MLATTIIQCIYHTLTNINKELQQPTLSAKALHSGTKCEKYSHLISHSIQAFNLIVLKLKVSNKINKNLFCLHFHCALCSVVGFFSVFAYLGGVF